jgi:Sec-independent protein secretion pathway components
MGPLGAQEIVVIFVLALLMFGPKKLPELGRTLAKGLAEFNRAKSELKATFDREMSSIERENQSLKEVTSKYTNEIYNYDNYYDSGAYGSETHEISAPVPTTVSASAPQGAEPEAMTSNGTEAAHESHTPLTGEHDQPNPAHDPPALKS